MKKIKLLAGLVFVAILGISCNEKPVTTPIRVVAELDVGESQDVLAEQW